MEDVRQACRIVRFRAGRDPPSGDAPFGAIEIPECVRVIQPIVTVVPLQLLAYHVAVEKGTDVDQPRNLAKSVTVE